MASTNDTSLIAEAIRRGERYASRFSLLDPDPWPLFVRYAGDKATFVPRDVFYFRDPVGPSACLWIVPGSCVK